MTDDESRLSRIETLWSVVRRAHGDGAVSDAQEQLLQRYGAAVRRYLRGALRNEDAADEVFQEFAVRFVRGDFKNADPDRGRFRSFVKTSLYHLIVDYQRRDKANRRNKDLVDVVDDPSACDVDSLDTQFDESWRSELLAKAWKTLQEHESKSGKPFFTVLRLRADNPDLRSTQLAELLTQKLGREVSSGNTRVLLHRAREVFAEELLSIVGQSLADPSIDRLEDELIALDLHDYCRQKLDERRNA